MHNINVIRAGNEYLITHVHGYQIGRNNNYY